MLEEYKKYIIEEEPFIIDDTAYFLSHYYTHQGNKTRCSNLREPISTIPTQNRFGLVVIRCKDCRIADIGLRMLKARELFNGNGFPKTYIIDNDYTGKKYPTTEQKARCGNAVVPILPKVLVQANAPELCGNRLEDAI